MPNSAVAVSAGRHASSTSSGATLVYACGTVGTCVWYQRGTNVVAGTLTGLSSPQGLAVDKAGNVYVANLDARNILVFAKGSNTLVKTLDDGTFYPVDVAVASDGTVYAANAFSHHISVFAPGSTTITRTIRDPNLHDPKSVAVDERQELLACYNSGHAFGSCDLFPQAHGNGTTVVSGLLSAGKAVFDNAGNVIVVDIGGGTKYFTPSFVQCGADPPSDIVQYLALDRSNGDIYKSNFDNIDIEENAYATCSGATNEFLYTAGWSDSNRPTSVAVDPASGI